MAFRVRDLVINVVPESGAGEGGALVARCPAIFSNCGAFTPCGGGWSGACHGPTCYGCTGRTFTCIGATSCGGCTLNVSVLPFAMGLTDSPEALGALKEQLKQTLQEVESAEAALAEQQQPQTVEEIEALEGKLQEALTELQSRKAQLQGREADAPGS
jgi:hypothetical protein